MPRTLQPCGTIGAYQRHIRRGQKPCDACRQARRDYEPANPGPIKHGTRSGYTIHIRRGEETCRPCRDAKAAYDRKYRATRRMLAESAA